MTSRFERHPRLTLAVVVIATVVATDFLAARLYEVLAGHPWYDRPAHLQALAERSYRVPSPYYHHDLAPNQVADGSWGGIRYPVHTNSLGFRDRFVRSVPLESPRHRLMFMGDSFTEGVGVAFDDSFVGIIERRLAEQRIEVLNAGVISYSPIFYWRKTKHLLETVGLRFEELAVFIDISDAQDETWYYLDDDGNIQEHVREDWNVFVEPPTFGRRVRDAVLGNSIVTYSVIAGLRNAVAPPEPEYRYGVGFTRGLWTADEGLFQEYGALGVERMIHYMDRLWELVQRHDIELIVAVYPWPDQIIRGDRESLHVKIWEDWTARNGVRFLDYFPEFIPAESTEEERRRTIRRHFLEGDIHWNVEGNRRIAEGFLEFHTSSDP